MSESCGCCDPPVGLAPLPVENRPGLSALSYRIGTYASFRATLLHKLSRPDALPRLTTRADDDFAVTFVDLWSAVADILTFYQERYANEAFLRTARERTSVGRLARLVGYALRPGAAATARLAFAVDPAAGRLTIPTRLRVKSVPAEGETAQTYETMEAIAADARLNALRIGPPPEPANPLARGATEALVAPGASADRALSDLAPGDRLLVFGSGNTVEPLVLEEVRTEAERTVLAWSEPVRSDTWTAASKLARVGRSFGLFGRSAPATYMTPTQSGATVAWTLTTRTDSAWTIASPGSALVLDGPAEVKPGTRLLLTGAGAPMPVTVTASRPVRGEFAPLSAPATELTVAETLPSLDRRAVTVHELLGDPLQLWGYAYPPTLSGARAYVPGRRLDTTTFDLGADGRLDLRDLELGRAAILSDERQSGVSATLVGASLTAPEPALGAADGDDAQLATLGLGPGEPVAVLASTPLGSTPDPRPAELEVTIGAVGPRTILLAGGDALAGELERLLREADAGPEFRRARVVAVGTRLAVVPGAAGASVSFAGTKADLAGAKRLGLDGESARPALLSGPVATAQPTGLPILRVRLGSAEHTLAPSGLQGTSGAATAAALQARLRTLPGRAFSGADVVFAGGRLLVLSGLPQAETQDFLRLDLRVPAGTVLDARSASLAGNVARASQGETVRDETVGSGDASVPFQRLALKKKPLTYVPGAGDSPSSLELLVEGVRWREVPSLFAARPADRVFAVEEAEDGSAQLRFGDGRMGSRLPSGMGNVRATYRFGSGLGGRVRAGTLTAALDRPRGLAGVVNPLPADGGADPEAADAARANAPQTVRTFGRAVSLRDFEDLVRASGEVAKAQAIWAWDGFARAVHLTVAQAGGGDFSPLGLRALRDALEAARDPNHPLHLANAVTLPIIVRARIGVEASRRREDVLAAARAALEAAFSFDAARLGEPVFVSEIFRVLQDVDGVEWVDVDELGIKRPPGLSDASWEAELTRRGVERTATGAVVPVQSRLRILPARPDPDWRGRVLPAELGRIEAPTHDVTLIGEGGLAA